VGFGALAYFRSQSEISELKQIIAKNLEEKMQQIANSSKEQLAQIAEQIKHSEAKIPKHETAQDSFANISRDYTHSIFLITGLVESGGERGLVPIGTGFSITESVLATNAHVAAALGDPRLRGGIAIMNKRSDRHCRINRVAIHPEYRGDMSDPKEGLTNKDVALLFTDCKDLRPTSIASEAELKALQQGEMIALLGFPGEIMDPEKPSAQLLQGIIGNIPNEVVIAHSMRAPPGTSGSPIFNRAGQIVALEFYRIGEVEFSVNATALLQLMRTQGLSRTSPESAVQR
jgi:hypothetical protein